MPKSSKPTNDANAPLAITLMPAPDKNIREMSDTELDAYAQKVVDAINAARNPESA